MNRINIKMILLNFMYEIIGQFKILMQNIKKINSMLDKKMQNSKNSFVVMITQGPCHNGIYRKTVCFIEYSCRLQLVFMSSNTALIHSVKNGG